MRVDQLPGAKVFTPVLWVILVGGLAAVIVIQWRSATPSVRIDERTVVSVLRSEPVKQLVVRKTATQVLVEYEEEDWLGHWRGLFWGSVVLHYGIDLEKVAPADLRRDGDTIVVRLPEPRLLSFSVEPETVGAMDKSTAVPKIADLMSGSHRKLLEEKFRRRAVEFAKGHDLMPDKATIVNELNAAVAAFRESGVMIRFE